MSLVTISLENLKFAPWGLLTDEERPRILVWLTPENPVGEIDSFILSDWDVRRIQQGVLIGAVSVEGLEFQNSGLSNPKPNITPISQDTTAKVASSTTIMDVTTLLRKELKQGDIYNQKIASGYQQADDVLNLPAHECRKKLKELAKDGTHISLFQDCRKKEIEGRGRKSIIALLVDIIQAKVAAVGVDKSKDRYSSQTVLSEAYYDLIEEFPDEDEELE